MKKYEIIFNNSDGMSDMYLVITRSIEEALSNFREKYDGLYDEIVAIILRGKIHD